MPLWPMLGCIGVAPPQEQSFRSGYLGPWGGNMDYREFGEGTTLYFGVNHPVRCCSSATGTPRRARIIFIESGHLARGNRLRTDNSAGVCDLTQRICPVASPFMGTYLEKDLVRTKDSSICKETSARGTSPRYIPLHGCDRQFPTFR